MENLHNLLIALISTISDSDLAPQREVLNFYKRALSLKAASVVATNNAQSIILKRQQESLY